MNNRKKVNEQLNSNENSTTISTINSTSISTANSTSTSNSTLTKTPSHPLATPVSATTSAPTYANPTLGVALQNQKSRNANSVNEIICETTIRTGLTAINVATACFALERYVTQMQTNSPIKFLGPTLFTSYKRAQLQSLCKNAAITNHESIEGNVHKVMGEGHNNEGTLQKMRTIVPTAAIVAGVDTLLTHPLAVKRTMADANRMLPQYGIWEIGNKIKFLSCGFPMRYTANMMNAMAFIVLQGQLNDKNNKNPVSATLAAGIIGGLGANGISRISKLQMAGLSTDSAYKIGKHIFKTEGIKGYFKGGTLTACITVIAYSTIAITDKLLTNYVFPKKPAPDQRDERDENKERAQNKVAPGRIVSFSAFFQRSGSKEASAAANNAYTDNKKEELESERFVTPAPYSPF